MNAVSSEDERVVASAGLADLLYGVPEPSLEALARDLWRDERAPAPDGAGAVIEAFLSSGKVRSGKQQVAALLLHGVALDNQFIDRYGVPVRNRAIEVVDEAMPDIYRLHGIDAREPAFEKLPKLRRIVPEAFESIDDASRLFISLETFDVARNAFQRAIGANRLLLAPFIPAPLLKVKVGEALDAVRALRDEDGPLLITAVERANELLADLETEMQSAGRVAKRVLEPVLESVRVLVDRVYSDSSVTDPGDLRVSAVAKKYPLSRPEESIRLSVRVENHGPGQALDAYLDELIAEGVELTSHTVPLGHLMPGPITVTIPASTTTAPADLAMIGGTVRWRDSDRASRSQPFELVFEAQRTDIDWDGLEQPYDLEPVSTAQELVGRREILRELEDLTGGRRIGNAFLTGQKRVGKTSIALTLRTSLADTADLAVVYLEAGSYVRPDGRATVAALGRAICEELLADARFEGVSVPDFDGETLAPLRGLIGQLRTRVPRLRVLIMLDEFDELPIELYRRGPVGDALFLSLRSLAGQDHIGFVLIGGEKMAPIVDAQGDSLNKFDNLPVSYFDRERHWDDFADLVTTPVRNFIEITDEALVGLFELSAGHPYFTKMICRSLFKQAVRDRDSHVTQAEVARASEDALASASTTNFTHFWEDGIVGPGEEVEEISVRRRKVLLALAESAEAGDRTPTAVERRANEYGVDDQQVRDLLREFARRDIVHERYGVLHAKVGLFDRWLQRYGVRLITTTFTDPDAVLRAKQREREERVEADEITDLVRTWGSYRGVSVSSDDVRTWLNQFDSVRAQRLMFGVLQAVRFYDADRIRAKLKEAHGIVRRGLTQRLDGRRTKRSDILVSYMGEVGQSGVRYARLYADENGIYTDQVVDRRHLPERLQEEQVQALVLVDDMIGSGEQACGFLTELNVHIGAILRKRGIKTVFVALAGFSDAERAVDATLEELDLPVELHICDPLGDGDHCFHDESQAFPDSAIRSEARGIAESHGKRLQRRHPLGYRDTQATVVFEDSCPNGTLPILWDSRNGWRPLFPRFART